MTQTSVMANKKRRTRSGSSRGTKATLLLASLACSSSTTNAFMTTTTPSSLSSFANTGSSVPARCEAGRSSHRRHSTFVARAAAKRKSECEDTSDNEMTANPLNGLMKHWRNAFETSAPQAAGMAASAAAGLLLSSALLFGGSPAFAENELSAKYGGGLDTSLVDQTCLVDQCSLQAKACLADDPDCRKGLTCTAKCLGDNACITGCMARYGNSHLDNLLKCTIEDHDCIKVAILPGGADAPGTEPRAPAPTLANFDMQSMQGTWYKVVGYNPNYDCYACQRNTFSSPAGVAGVTPVSNNKLEMDVEFSMPHLLPDGSPPPPANVREIIRVQGETTLAGPKSIGLNDYNTHETMVFDNQKSALEKVVFFDNKAKEQKLTYARTAHSEGEMFGLKFWENWYILGENEPDEPEFKFIFYNGKTRQNTYEGAFVYSRTKELAPESMKKVYQIARDAGMNPDQFCRIRNGCFADDTIIKEPETGLGSPSNPFRGILASTKVSQLLGVEPVVARDSMVRRTSPTAKVLMPPRSTNVDRAWWYNVGDYFENPHRHFEAMNDLRVNMDWPEDVVASASSSTPEQQQQSQQ